MWSERLWGESRAVFFSDNPLHRVKVTHGHPSPPHLSPGSSSAALSHPAKPYSRLNPAGWSSAAQPAPAALGGTAEEPARMTRSAASPPHPPGSRTPASPPLEMGDRSARAVNAKDWQGASGGGEGDACESARCCHPLYVGIKHPPASV